MKMDLNHRVSEMNWNQTAGTAATSARWPTGSESVGPGVDRAGTDLRALRGSVRDGLFGSLGELGVLGERRLFGSGFEPQSAQRNTEGFPIRVHPSRPLGESGSVVGSASAAAGQRRKTSNHRTDPLAGFSVGRGVDPAGSVAGQRRKTSFHRTAPFFDFGRVKP